MSGAAYTTWSLYRRIFREARGYWPHLAGLLVLSLLSTPLALLTPLPLKIVVDSVLGSQPLPQWLEAVVPDVVSTSTDATLALAAAMVVIVALLGQLQGLVSQVARTYTGQKLLLDFRSQLFRHAQRLSLAYHDSKGASDSTHRIHYDASAVKQIAMEGVIPFVSSAVKVAAMIYVTSRTSPQLAAVALVVLPCLFMALRLSSRRLRGGWREVKMLDSAAMSLVQEVLGGVRVVKAFGQEDREQARYVKEATQKMRARMRLAFLQSGLGLLIGVIVAVGTAAVLAIGVREVLSGALTLGSLLLVMSYLSQLYGPLEKMSQRIGDVQSAFASAERAFVLRDQIADVPERPNAIPLRRAKGTIAFDRVSFSYGNHPILNDISFNLDAGKRLGIEGTSGAGKTTLVSLLTRFYDPSLGRILLDGVDLRDYKVAHLRDQFAIVLQEPVLFSTSIAENIAYARPGASPDDIAAAARAAHAHEFIARLPDGYATVVGERGARLSGGERQRIALARAFLKDAPVLILDEPTSSVDTKTEAIILEAMQLLMRGRTTIMIAHRASALESCDARLVIEQGRIVEEKKSVA